MDVWLNGEMVAPERATVRADDAGLQHAVGLFETMLVAHGSAWRLEQHLDRLASSAAELGIERAVDRIAMTAAVAQTIAHNKLERGRLRLTLTPGSLSLLQRAAQGSGGGGDGGDGGGNGTAGVGVRPTLLIQAGPGVATDPASHDRGISVVIGPAAANPFDPLAGHKTLNYWARLQSLREAAAVGGGESIWLQVTNHLAGGCVSNLFLIRGGELFTPIARGEEKPGALPAPVRPGVTRAAVIELARAMGLTVHRRMLAAADLVDADEAFVTNSGWLLLPITRVERSDIGDGSVGPLTRRLRAALLEMVERETQESKEPRTK